MQNTDTILTGLNEKQREAVLIESGPVLIFAGAGSGKTKCLTHRIAYLISRSTDPERILAVTFTNKAAEEMKHRVGRLLTDSGFAMRGSPWIGTFHSFGAYVLRQNAEHAERTRSFSIFDEDDVLSLVKDIQKELNISPKQYPPAMMLSAISGLKNEGTAPDDYDGKDSGDPFPKTLWKIYDAYERKLKEGNGFDFDDLILKPLTLFKKYPEVLGRYQAIRDAHDARGLKVRPMTLAVPLIILTLKNADDIAAAIDARGIRGHKHAPNALEKHI